MRPIPPGPCLRSLLDDRLAAGASEFDLHDGTWALAWVPEGHPSPRTVVFHNLYGATPRVALVDADPRQAGEWLPAWPGLSGVSDDTVVARVFSHRGASPDEVTAFARSLGGTCGAAAASFLAEGSIHDGYRLWDWLSHPVEGPHGIAFCREHPWMAREAFDTPGFRAALAERDPTAMARWGATVAALPILGEGEMEALPDDAAGRVVEALRRMRLPPGGLGEGLGPFVRGVSVMPRDMWPAPIPAGDPGGEPAQADAIAFFLASPLAASLARGRSRSMRRLLGMGARGWAEYLSHLHARSGNAPVGGLGPVGTATVQGMVVASGIRDMTEAFTREILVPALLASAPGARLPPPRERRVFREAAFRILTGDRTLPRVCEVSAEWHRRQGPILAYLQGLRGETGCAGPLLFTDLDLGGDLYATCLHTPGELAFEGGRGPDPRGVQGLCHCVGGYADEVLEGRTAIVSIRRRTADGSYERLSTVELDYAAAAEFSVRQHHGRRNGPPPQEAVAALPGLLAATGDGARKALAAHRPVSRRSDLSEVIHEAGAWERVRDLWSFALTRPQRAMSARQFAVATGVSAA